MIKTESPQNLVIATKSECKYNKWQLSFKVNVVLLNADGSISPLQYCV